MANKKKWKLIFFVIGILVLAYMIYAIGLDTIWENISKTGWWFIPILCVWLVVYIINALAWNSLIKDKDNPNQNNPSFLKVLRVTISGYAINYITPVVALGGEPYRILEMQENLGTNRATSNVLSYSMMHMLSHVVFWMGAIILILLVLKPGTALTIGCIVTFAVFCFLLYLIFKGYRKGLIVKFFRILEKIPFIKKPIKRFTEKKLPAFEEIDRHITNLYTYRKKTFFKALSLEVLARIICCFELYFVGRCAGMGLNFLDSVILYAGSSLFSNILFFSPMQLGTREGGLALTLKMMGFSAGLGIYIGVIVRIRELIWICIGLALMRLKK